MFTFAADSDFTDEFHDRLKASGYDPQTEGDLYGAFFDQEHPNHQAVLNACSDHLPFQMTLYGALLVEHDLQPEDVREQIQPYFDKASDLCFIKGIKSTTSPLSSLRERGCTLISDSLMVTDTNVRRDMYVHLYRDLEDFESNGFDFTSPDEPWGCGYQLARYARLVDVQSSALGKNEFTTIPPYAEDLVTVDYLCSGQRNVTDVALAAFEKYSKHAKKYPSFIRHNPERLSSWPMELARLARLNDRNPKQVIEGLRAIHDVIAEQAKMSPQWRGVFVRQAMINAVALWPQALAEIEPPVKPIELLPHPALRDPESLVRAEMGMDEVLQGAYRTIRPESSAMGHEMGALARAAELQNLDQLEPLIGQTCSGDLTLALDMLKRTGGYFEGIDSVIASPDTARTGRSQLLGLSRAIDASRVSPASLDRLNYLMVMAINETPYPDPAQLVRYDGYAEALIRLLKENDKLTDRTAVIAGLPAGDLLRHQADLSLGVKRYVIEQEFGL